MDPTVAPTWLDKYGPMGCALLVVCFVLWLLVSRFIPVLLETWGRRLDQISRPLHALLETLTARLDLQEASNKQRHEAVVNRLESIDRKIDRLPSSKTEEPHDG